MTGPRQIHYFRRTRNLLLPRILSGDLSVATEKYQKALEFYRESTEYQ
jgi:hypothetical protein